MDNYGPVGQQACRLRFGRHRTADLRLLPVGYHAWCLENHRYGYTPEQIECVLHFMGGAEIKSNQAQQMRDDQLDPKVAADVPLHAFMTWWTAMQSEIRNAYILYGNHRPTHEAAPLPSASHGFGAGVVPWRADEDEERPPPRRRQPQSPDPEPTKLMDALVEWYDELSKYFDPMLHQGDQRPIHIVDLARDKMFEILKRNSLIVEEEVEQVNRRSIQI